VLAFDGLNFPTGLYPYTITVTQRTTTGNHTGSASGELAIVNRKDSPFGAGWWLAGFEQLIPQSNGSLFWIGGDGSTRRYADVGVVGMHHKWVAPSVDRPDTIAFTGANYVRYLRGGVQVVFTANGKHWQTISPLNIATTFHPDLQDRLSSIELPGTAQRYTFAYDGNEKVSSITAPNVGPARATLLQVTGGLLTSITDPDGHSVGFTHSAAAGFENMISERTNRRNARQLFGYSGVHHLSESKLGLGPLAGDTIRTTFCAGEGVGHVGSNCNTSPFVLRTTTINGPRMDSTDVTSIVIEPFGGPYQITDAHNNVTTLTRADSRFPALVTRIVFPDSFERRAGYDTRGNIVADSAMNALGDGRAAVTLFEWDAKWDKPTKITQPEGNFVEFQYDALTSNRLWAQDNRGATARTTFGYDTEQLLRAVELPPDRYGQRATDSLFYDPLGNLSAVRTASGVWTQIESDAIGRATVVARDITAGGVAPSARATMQRDSTIYDMMGRDSITVSIGPPLSGVSEQRLTVRKTYDAEGNLTRLVREPNSGPITSLTSLWGYDLADRAVADTAPFGSGTSVFEIERRHFDHAGNVDTVWTRTGDVLAMQYDALNRLISRSIPGRDFTPTFRGYVPSRANFSSVQSLPIATSQRYPRIQNDSAAGLYRIAADVEQFRYDVRGRLTSATNATARVGREYLPNGVLAAETDSVTTLAGGDFTQHIYRTSYEYNLNSQLLTLRYPSQLAPTSGASRGYVSYDYRPETGQLRGVTDLLGNAFTFAYDSVGQLVRTGFPGNPSQAFDYDVDGRLTGDTIRSNVGALLRATTFAYADARGKVTAAINQVGKRDTLLAAYSGLGHLVSTLYADDGPEPYTGLPLHYRSGDTTTFDPLGNRLNVLSHDAQATANSSRRGRRGPRAQNYDAGTGRLVRVIPAPPQFVTDTLSYDAAGNEAFRTCLSCSGGSSEVFELGSFYDAAGRLRVADQRTYAQNIAVAQPQSAAFDEHWYDALGRRVLTRSLKLCDPPTRTMDFCQVNPVRRTVWGAGPMEAQELFEIQMPALDPALRENDTGVIPDQGRVGQIIGNVPEIVDRNTFFGRVGYTHAFGIDQPVSLTRWGYQDTSNPDGSPATFERWVDPFTIVPHWNTRGQADNGTFANGTTSLCGGGLPPGGGGSSGRCVQVAWPLGWTALNMATARSVSWHGTVLEDKRDGSLLQFKRNRYYDPSTGQFTQEDPIGLAGGLNLYGFADGDPVNFSDPFGLCPLEKTGEPCAGGSASASMAVFSRLGSMPIGEAILESGMLGLSSALGGELATGVATAAGRVLGAVSKGRTLLGRDAVMMGSEVEARLAGRLFTGPGSRVIHATRGTGDEIGRISADATRVYRSPQMKYSGPNAGMRAANLVRRGSRGEELSNLHLIIPP
jgi:RHS repeat-associated protein